MQRPHRAAPGPLGAEFGAPTDRTKDGDEARPCCASMRADKTPPTTNASRIQTATVRRPSGTSASPVASTNVMTAARRQRRTQLSAADGSTGDGIDADPASSTRHIAVITIHRAGTRAAEKPGRWS